MAVGIVLLAAGGSKRLGRSKQLLPFRDGTLLSHAARQAKESKADKVLIVLGPAEDQCVKQLDKLDVSSVVNANWRDGMASSIRAGVAKLAEDRDIDAVLIMTCDQPHVKHVHLDELIDGFRENHGQLLATAYDDSFGIPALFSRQYFNALCELQGDSGAKTILRQHLNSLVCIALEEASFDIDTEEDYESLR